MQLKTLSLKFNGAHVPTDDGKSFEAWKSHTEYYFCVHACVSVLCIYFFLCVNGKELVLWGTAVLIARPGVFSQAHTSVLALAPLTFSWNEEGGGGHVDYPRGRKTARARLRHDDQQLRQKYIPSPFPARCPFICPQRWWGLGGAFKRHTVSVKLWQRLFIAVFGVRPSVGRLLYWFDNLIARSSFFFFLVHYVERMVAGTNFPHKSSHLWVQGGVVSWKQARQTGRPSQDPTLLESISLQAFLERLRFLRGRVLISTKGSGAESVRIDGPPRCGCQRRLVDLEKLLILPHIKTKRVPCHRRISTNPMGLFCCFSFHPAPERLNVFVGQKRCTKFEVCLSLVLQSVILVFLHWFY